MTAERKALLDKLAQASNEIEDERAAAAPKKRGAKKRAKKGAKTAPAKKAPAKKAPAKKAPARQRKRASSGARSSHPDTDGDGYPGPMDGDRQWRTKGGLSSGGVTTGKLTTGQLVGGSLLI
jgi:hypothetical protein